jgi:telomere length regulation protein
MACQAARLRACAWERKHRLGKVHQASTSRIVHEYSKTQRSARLSQTDQGICFRRSYLSVMTDFLTAVSTKKVKSPEPLIQDVRSLDIQEDALFVNSTESALGALKNQPNRKTVSKVLSYLTTEGFSLLLPEPLNASIAHQLINDTIPNYWRTIKGSIEVLKLEDILRNPTGLGHLNTRLRSLIADSRQKKAPGDARNTAEHIADTLEILSSVLSGDETSHRVLQDVLAYGKNSTQRKLIWKEYLAQVASGRLLSIAAEAEDILKKSDGVYQDAVWVADGKEYAAWLGRNIAILLERSSSSEEGLTAVIELCSKALSLGYTGMSAHQVPLVCANSSDRIVSSLFRALIDSSSLERLPNLLPRMKTFEQRKYLNAIVVLVTKEYFSVENVLRDDASIAVSSTVSSAAALFYTLIKDNDVLKEHLVSLLSRSTIPALDESLLSRRSALAALAKDDGQYRLCTHWYLRLTAHREVTYSSRESHKNLWRFCIHKAYACTAARRYVMFVHHMIIFLR